MDPLDLILAKLSGGWDFVLQHLEIPEVMYVFALVLLVVSLGIINQRH
jgi:hypothetical protein